jgi:hypothetical protein
MLNRRLLPAAGVELGGVCAHSAKTHSVVVNVSIGAIFGKRVNSLLQFNVKRRGFGASRFRAMLYFSLI